MDEFLNHLRSLFGWRNPSNNESRATGQEIEGRTVDSSETPYRSTSPIFFNIRQEPKIADAARRTDLYFSPSNGSIDRTMAMNADELRGLLENYYDADNWDSREQAASAIRSRVKQIDPNGRSTALNKWLDYFNGGHQNLVSGRDTVDFDYFMEELNEVLDGSKKTYIRRA
jgi:hypothetical protein